MKLSWTILNLWSSGRRDEAIKVLSGIELPKNEAMENGSRLHDIVANKKLRLIPEITDKAIFENFKPEEKKWVGYYKVKLFDWLDLSMVIDVLDGHRIIDWKASTLRSTEHNKMQIYLYALGVEKATGKKITEGIFGTIKEWGGAVICDDYSVFKINDKKKELALNYAETIGSEIYSFLQDN